MAGADNLHQKRIGTTERESAVSALGIHLSEGRLSLEEYEQRLTNTMDAKTNGQLLAVFTDLPAPHPVLPGVPTLRPPTLRGPSAPPATDDVVYSSKSKIAAGVLQLVPSLGIGRFYTGHVGIGLAQLLLTPVFGIGVLWCWIDGILLIANGGRDRNGLRLRD
ncbi:hypothetical protein FHR81_002390 [Actinoalloteichus hoggarensis]|uniref:DUF1707 domain-containing protein n=1 Tax=Actinoalloteichus hoggarensis TaxID=1470176 RepID=UPI000B8AAC7A|nr:DUF1707 domain-containing protein [Actinoalloteichus hoggarensis]MBB5921352.1 hypothetical protein [Actinoalloteichus hoggarensis]